MSAQVEASIPMRGRQVCYRREAVLWPATPLGSSCAVPDLAGAAVYELDGEETAASWHRRTASRDILGERQFADAA
jgi:hypothetical protein